MFFKFQLITTEQYMIGRLVFEKESGGYFCFKEACKMNEKNYNTLLYEKMKHEYDEFIEDLKLKTPDKIIRHSYEKVMKEEILSCFESSDRPQKEAKALYLLKYPLEEIYQEWLGNDYSYMYLIQYTIDDRIKSAVKEMNQKQKESR